MARILAVLHSPAEPLGALEPPIVAAGHVIEARVMPGPLPTSLAGYEGLIVMGGDMGVYEADRYPFLAEEVRLLREALSRACPRSGSASAASSWPPPAERGSIPGRRGSSSGGIP